MWFRAIKMGFYIHEYLHRFTRRTIRGGEGNDYIVRESYIFDIQADLFDAEATVASGGSTGAVLQGGGPIMSDQARDHVYEGACFSAG